MKTFDFFKMNDLKSFNRFIKNAGFFSEQTIFSNELFKKQYFFTEITIFLTNLINVFNDLKKPNKMGRSRTFNEHAQLLLWFKLKREVI